MTPIRLPRRTLGGLVVGAASFAAFAARSQTRPLIKIGVMNDQSGPYSNASGSVSVACTRQAVLDFAGGAGAFDIEVIVGDHQNKPDVGISLARSWFDQAGVDMIVDVPTSSVALGVAQIAKEKNKVYVNSNAATPDLTGPQCNANTLHWTYDTYMLAKSTGGAAVAAGGDSWFFLAVNYIFGQQLEQETASLVTQSGGKVLGAAFYPFPETVDFGSYLLQAQASGAKVVGLATAGDDTVNIIKQAHEFGLMQGGTKLAGLLILINMIHAIGLDVAQGLLLTESYYWDLNERTRAFHRRLAPHTSNVPANMGQAGCYSGTLHYLKAVAAMGPAAAKADGAGVVARMKATPTDDDVFGRCDVREDGRLLCPAYLFQIKSPTQSTAAWDYYSLVSTTPGAEAAMPLVDAKCPLVKA